MKDSSYLHFAANYVMVEAWIFSSEQVAVHSKHPCFYKESGMSVMRCTLVGVLSTLGLLWNLSDELFARMRAVALSGDPVPASDSSATLSWVSAFALNNLGEVALVGGMQGPAIVAGENAVGIWTADQTGKLTKVMQAGEQAFEMSPNVRFAGRTPALHGFSESGDAMFVGGLTGPGIIENPGGTCGSGPPDASRGVWRADGDHGELVVRQGDVAPGTPAGTLFHCCVRDNRINNRGESAFSAAVYSGTLTTPTGVWRENEAGALEPILVSGEEAVEVVASGGESYIAGSAQLVGFNDLGTVAVKAWPSKFQSGSPSIISLAPKNAPRTLVAMEGETIADAGTNVVIQKLGPAALNNQNLLALHVELAGPDVVMPQSLLSTLPSPQLPAPTNRAIVLAGANQEPQVLVRSGDSADGLGNANLVYYAFGFISSYTSDTPPFATYFPFADLPSAINSRGQVLYHATINSLQSGSGLSSSNNEGLWVHDPQHGNRLVVREGNIAPGSTGSFNFRASQFDYLLNELGQVAIATLVDGKRGLWATDLEGELQRIVMEGQTIEVSPGDHRVVEELDVPLSFSIDGSSTGSSTPTVFNDRGQLAFWAQFTDGTSGIFVSDAVAAFSGDYDLNGTIGPEDYSLWKSSFGSTTNLAADGNYSGIVDAADYTIWRDQFDMNVGAEIGGASRASVPEPAGTLLVLVALIGISVNVRARRFQQLGQC
jgi:hypothetical protein